jgi:hypothetical protein
MEQPGRLVRRDVVHVQDLLNYIVNLPEHETAHLSLSLGRREQNDSRDHGANVRENVAKFVWRAQLGFYVFPHGGCPFERWRTSGGAWRLSLVRNCGSCRKIAPRFIIVR